MFSTFTQKLLLGIYIFILLSIPVGAYLSTQITSTKSRASEPKPTKLPVAKVTPKPITSPAKELLNSTTQSATSAGLPASPTPSPETTIATSFGPTLSFKASFEGRPANNQAGRVFVGIAGGTLSSNSKFLLSFSVDLPASGQYSNLSLAGLDPGSKYTALIKGSAQIAASVTFTMSPTTTNLNDGQPITLTSGDLNEDNVINSADYSIAQKALGTNQENADLNSDGVINVFDLGIISNNLGKIGASGAWTSPIPKVATASASLSTSPSAGSPSGQSGHWIWIPNL